MKALALLLATAFAAPAQSVHPLEALIDLARQGPATPGLAAAIEKTLSPNGGTAVWGQDFLFVTRAAAPARISLNQQAPVAMQPIQGSNLWMHFVKLRTGVTHAYQFHVEGQPPSNRSDVTGYNPDSYPKNGVPKGTLSAKNVITSRVFDGMKADYWIYASPGVNPATPAPLMVWQDGQTLVNGDLTRMRLFTVTENLVHQKRIPPMVHVLIAPGFAPDGRALRSLEYDSMDDRYTRFLLEEVLPEVEKSYKLRPDGYSRAIGGESSGGICSFTAAWLHPEKFARVHSTIGSYTSIQWRPKEGRDGGNLYPFLVRKEAKRNIRVWLSDGSDDLENAHGSWPLQNIQLANSLKMKEYDYHFRFASAAHNSAQAALDLPESLTWLWRGYDPAKTSEEFVMDPAEKDKPFYRVTISNRDAW
ncbi:MAG: alpha/beta hydrolase-fold protein [Bryobacteraceae bacterium]|nr:esterase family protein [Solibacteraceae bacterium]MCO5349914.1 alpha/beta hydrolase-fold protein [Bryobacteraceae bacterium]